MLAFTRSWAVLAACAALSTCSQPDTDGGPGQEASTGGHDSGSGDASSIASRCSPPAGLRCPPGSAWEARHGLDSAEYQQTFDTLVGQGYRLSHVSGYSLGGQGRYAAIWEKCDSPEWEARHGLSSAEYQQNFDTFVGQGYRLVQVSGYTVAAQDLYSAIFEKSQGPAWEARHGLDSAAYQQAFDTFVGQGYRLADVSGYENRFAGIWTK